MYKSQENQSEAISGLCKTPPHYMQQQVIYFPPSMLSIAYSFMLLNTCNKYTLWPQLRFPRKLSVIRRCARVNMSVQLEVCAHLHTFFLNYYFTLKEKLGFCI